MPTILRNPFRKNDENLRPPPSLDPALNPAHKPLDVKPPVEYKLSGKPGWPSHLPLPTPLIPCLEINDSGICLPPSPPPERRSFWNASSRTTSSTSTTHRSLVAENEPFNISRESFDSYRRSFDISGRSPVIPPNDPAARPRASLDTRTFLPPPPVRTSNSFTRPSAVPAQTQEETDPFEDVDIVDHPVVSLPPKKRGLFARLTDSADQPPRPHSTDAKTSWHHFGGRKRAQSGQGAELGHMPARRVTTPKIESQLKKEASKPVVGPQDQATIGTPAPLPQQTVLQSTENQDTKKKTPTPAPQSHDTLDTVQSDLQDVTLDDDPTNTPPPHVTETAPSDAAASESEAPHAPRPTNLQAPEMRIDS
ncbi:Ubiquitin-conjugating enzyme E2 S-C [Teratosphaeria destructans]|uniref:Ubiquitin-conjugating enzyme E2 S-C n=1 Tax=Teratosphaeria destructans TaxID=418781 RepID=A0A9W7W003_9PEZI|nr:Ubiquitin-conjugating enzyme E2 S-C [Teratosphaeria destructans]